MNWFNALKTSLKMFSLVISLIKNIDIFKKDTILANDFKNKC